MCVHVLLSNHFVQTSISSGIKFMLKKRILCDHCRGSGAASDGDIHTCTSCNGAGVKIIKQQVRFKVVQVISFSKLIFPARYFPACLHKVKYHVTNAADEGLSSRKHAPIAKVIKLWITLQIIRWKSHLVCRKDMRLFSRARQTKAQIGRLAMSL